MSIWISLTSFFRVARWAWARAPLLKIDNLRCISHDATRSRCAGLITQVLLARRFLQATRSLFRYSTCQPSRFMNTGPAHFGFFVRDCLSHDTEMPRNSAASNSLSRSSLFRFDISLLSTFSWHKKSPRQCTSVQIKTAHRAFTIWSHAAPQRALCDIQCTGRLHVQIKQTN